MKLLEQDEQARIRALIINKFRGDVEILRPGLTQLEELTGKPVAGVVPYGGSTLTTRDSLSERLDGDARSAGGTNCGRAVAAALELHRLCRARKSTRCGCLLRGQACAAGGRRPDYPARHESDAFRPEMAARERHGSADFEAACGGYTGVCVCGGFQMLGRTVSDPENTEGGGSLRGLGLLPVDTVFRPRKTTVQARGVVGALSGVLAGLSDAAVNRYTFIVGETERDAAALLFSTLTRADGTVVSDGCQAENAYGTYLHGVFDAPGVALRLAQALATRKGVSLGRCSVRHRSV